MKVAFVLGFFEDVVGTAIRTEFSEALKDKRVVIFGHRWSNPHFDLGGFRSTFFEQVQDGSQDPIIVIGQVRVRASAETGKDWLAQKLEEIVETGRTRAAGREIRLSIEKNAQNPDPIIETLRAYGFSEASEEVSGQDIGDLLKGGTALCVRPIHQSKYQIAITRANIKCDFDEHFVERVLSYNPKEH